MPVPVKTARAGLNTWPTGDIPFTRAQRNEDAAQLDEVVALDDQGAFADRPAAAPANRGLYYFVDAGANAGKLYRSTGAAWVLINPDVAAPDLSGYATNAALAGAVAPLANTAAVNAALAGKLGVGAKAADSELLDGHDSTFYTPVVEHRSYARAFLTAGI